MDRVKRRKLAAVFLSAVLLSGCQHLGTHENTGEPQGPFTDLYQVPKPSLSKKLIVRPAEKAMPDSTEETHLPVPEPAAEAPVPEPESVEEAAVMIPPAEPLVKPTAMAAPEPEVITEPVPEVLESESTAEPVYEISASDQEIPAVSDTIVNARYFQARFARYEEIISLQLITEAEGAADSRRMLDVTGPLLAGRGTLKYFWEPQLWQQPADTFRVFLEGRTRDGLHFRGSVHTLEEPGVVSANVYETQNSFTASIILRGLLEGDRIDFAYEKHGGALTDFIRARKNPLFCEVLDEQALMAACKAPLTGIRPGDKYSLNVTHQDSGGRLMSEKIWEHQFEAVDPAAVRVEQFYIVPWTFKGTVTGLESVARAWISFEKYGSRQVFSAAIADLDVTEHLKNQKGSLEMEMPLKGILPGFYFAYLNLETADGRRVVSWEAPFSVKSPEQKEAEKEEKTTASQTPSQTQSGLAQLIEEEVDAASAPGASRLKIHSFYTVGYGLYGQLEGLSDLRHAALRMKWSFSNARDFENQDVTEILKIQKGDLKIKDFLLNSRKPGNYAVQLILRDQNGRTVKSPEVNFRVAGILETSEQFEQGHVFFMAQAAGLSETDRVAAVYRLKDVKIFGGILNKQYEVELECGDPNDESIAVCYSTEKSKLNPWREYEYYVVIRDYQGNVLARTRMIEFASHNQRINAIQQEAEKIEVKITSFKLAQNEVRAFVKGHLNMEKAQLKIKRLLPPAPAFSQVFDVTEQIISSKGVLAHPVKDLKTGFYSCQLTTISIDGTRAQSPEVSFQWAV